MARQLLPRRQLARHRRVDEGLAQEAVRGHPDEAGDGRAEVDDATIGVEAGDVIGDVLDQRAVFLLPARQERGDVLAHGHVVEGQHRAPHPSPGVQNGPGAGRKPGELAGPRLGDAQHDARYGLSLQGPADRQLLHAEVGPVLAHGTERPP
jgi:hypothetical protein